MFSYKLLKKNLKSSLRFLAIPLLICSCTIQEYKKPDQKQESRLYRTNPPDFNVSSSLEKVLLSVKKITNYTSYQTYVFEENSHITWQRLKSEEMINLAKAGVVTNDATSGTGLVIQSNGNQIALLTCAHVVNRPDTIIQWDAYSDLNDNRYILGISVKRKQQLFVRDLPENSKFSVLAADAKNDIALIGQTFSNPVGKTSVFEYNCGNSSLLNWGNFIYLAGFPLGQLMVSHGLVSKSPDNSGTFLTDAPFNEGFSGGIAFAMRENSTDFELLGIAKSVASTDLYTLKPEKGRHEFNYSSSVPYNGRVYVEQLKEINYGITNVVSIDQIKQFYRDNRTAIISKGYNFDQFFLSKN